MAIDLTETLVIGISATALFDLSDADHFFRENYERDKTQAIKAYRQYMQQREDQDLQDGTAMPLVEALLKLNSFAGKENAALVEVLVMSRNSPETGIRVFNNIRRKGLNITRHVFTGGESVVDYISAFKVDLFLTTNVADAQKVIDSGVCAAAILKQRPAESLDIPKDQVRIAFDGDAVLFDESSEIVYKAEGLEKFHAHENSKQDLPLPEGPYANLLKKLAKLQDRLPVDVTVSPIRIAIVTARSAPAELRVIKTLRHWGVYVDEIFFLGGVQKTAVLKAFKPHIFFDDQDLHLEPAAKIVNAGKVLYRSGSILRK